MNRRQLLLGLGSAFVAAACGSSPHQPSPIPQPPPQPQPPPPGPPRLGITRILAFGDSMTAGTTSAPLPGVHGLDAGLPQSYVFKLQTLLTQRYSAQSVLVFNEGRAGNRAAEDQGRLIERDPGVEPGGASVTRRRERFEHGRKSRRHLPHDRCARGFDWRGRVARHPRVHRHAVRRNV